VLARMLHAPVLARPEYGAHTPIIILLGSDVPTARYTNRHLWEGIL
jgi:hypothetical protein